MMQVLTSLILDKELLGRLVDDNRIRDAAGVDKSDIEQYVKRCRNGLESENRSL